MEHYSEKIKCQLCKKPVNVPFKSPCLASICKVHVGKTNTIDCKSCNSTHASKDYVNNGELNGLIITLGCIKGSYSRFDMLKEKPLEFIDLYIEELRNKIDLKREEIKLELDVNAKKIFEELSILEKNKFQDSLLFKQDVKRFLIEIQYFLKDSSELDVDYESVNLMSQVTQLTNERINQKLEELKCQMDDSCINIISDLDNYRDTCIESLSSNQIFIDRVSDKLNSYKEEIAGSCEQFTCTSFSSVKTTNNVLSRVMRNIHKDLLILRNTILLNRGFEFERKQFNYPDLEYFKGKNKGVLKLKLEKVSQLIKTGRAIIGKKSPINYIPFGIGTQMKTGKFGHHFMKGGLFFDNKYEFSGIVANCQVYLESQSRYDKLVEVKSFTQHCNRVNTYKNFKQILHSSDILKSEYYNTKDDSIQLVVNVELVDLKIRSLI